MNLTFDFNLWDRFWYQGPLLKYCPFCFICLLTANESSRKLKRIKNCVLKDKSGYPEFWQLPHDGCFNSCYLVIWTKKYLTETWNSMEKVSTSLTWTQKNCYLKWNFLEMDLTVKKKYAIWDITFYNSPSKILVIFISLFQMDMI